MRKIQPVDIDGITFDAVITQTTDYTADVPSYPTEAGFEVSDAIIVRPLTLNLTLIISNNPVTHRAINGQNPARVQEVLARLRDCFFKREPVTVTTQTAVYEMMAIENFSDTISKDYGDMVELPISLRQIVKVERQTTTMEVQFLGPANVVQENPPTSSSSTVNNSNYSNDSSSSKSNASALHNLASSLGILK
ncbi:MAG: hypothetical protein FWG64_05520 [Firmicutes bacterium]|nr:hypothetical protein [Bacillota bacterium]